MKIMEGNMIIKYLGTEQQSNSIFFMQFQQIFHLNFYMIKNNLKPNIWEACTNH